MHNLLQQLRAGLPLGSLAIWVITAPYNSKPSENGNVLIRRILICTQLNLTIFYIILICCMSCYNVLFEVS